MKKSDLKTGMIVEFTNHNISIVMLNCATTKEGEEVDLLANILGGFMELSSYNDDLVCSKNNDYDIIKIHYGNRYDLMSGVTQGLLWERTPEKIIEFDGVEYSESTLRSIIKKATE